MQENWIGKSDGANVRFALKVEGEGSEGEGRWLETFTTRVDTLSGVQYLALSHTHPLVVELAGKNADLAVYILECTAEAAAGADRDHTSHLPKRGFRLPGVYAESPLFPGTFDIPVYAAEYVLDGYGSGAVMGVPGHDLRDNAFFKTHFPQVSKVRVVIAPAAQPEQETNSTPPRDIYTSPGILTAEHNPPQLAGLTSSQAFTLLTEKLHLATPHSQYRLRDWLVSRQRYWGAPIPIIHCPSCGEVPVPDDQLPVELPTEVAFTGRGGSPLATGTWKEVDECPKCGGSGATRDTDTMDTFVDSSWYFIRFVDPKNGKE